MNKKRFIKMCMSIGVHRNAANWLAKHKSRYATQLLGRAIATHQITNCKETKDAVNFTVKPRKAGGGNE